MIWEHTKWIYNENNLTNIYKYNPTLVYEINKTINQYNHYQGYSRDYRFLIEEINNNFNFFKKEHMPLIYHLTDRIYTQEALKTISHYTDAIFKVSKNNDYTDLLDFVKYEDNNLYNYFERLKSSNNIYDRTELESEVAYDLKADPYDTNAEELQNNLSKTTNDWILVKRNNQLVEFESEKDVLEMLYNLEFQTFNQVFFNNLDLLKMENPTYDETEQEMEI